jgi:hypothetical protein
MKYNMYSSGPVYTANIIIKLKKLFNNVRKYYELNMYKIFLTIDKYGRSIQESESARERQERASMVVQKRQNGGTKKMELPAHHSSHVLHREEYVIDREQVVIFDQHQTRIIEGSGTINQASAARATILSRGISVQIMDRIFRKNIKKYIAKWRRGASTQSGLE